MSRIGKVPIVVDKTLQVEVGSGSVTVKNSKNSMNIPVSENVNVEFKDGMIQLTRNGDTKEAKSQHGLYRSLIQNAVTGLSTGFTKTLILNGVGYRSAVKGKQLELNLGYSHPILHDIPAGIEVSVEKNTTVHIKGFDKQLVGQTAANIRSYREPEPYLGKGIRYSDEQIRRKAGKAAGK